MSDLNENQIDTGEEDSGNAVLPVQDELTALKQRADLMGMKYHPSISAATLRIKIAEYLQSDNKTPAPVTEDGTVNTAGTSANPEAPVVPAGLVAKHNPDNGSVTYALDETPAQKRRRLQRLATEQVRIRVTCMNPAKKEWHGEIFTVGNGAVGTLKKFVPFNAEEGWHVPRMILDMMQQRQCQIFVNSKTKNGVTVRQGKLIKEFAIEILEPLTQSELNELARRQAMAAGQE